MPRPPLVSASAAKQEKKLRILSFLSQEIRITR
jgi:hypothetical protein